MKSCYHRKWFKTRRKIWGKQIRRYLTGEHMFLGRQVCRRIRFEDSIAYVQLQILSFINSFLFGHIWKRFSGCIKWGKKRKRKSEITAKR
jgi:hypothetical protein